MKGAFLLARVSKAWVFREELYPALETLQDEQALVFSLTHVLKHQSKGASWCVAVRKGLSTPPLSEVKERLLKMMVNSIRFHQLVDADVGELDAVLGWWGCAGASVCDVEMFNRIKYGNDFKRSLHGFVEATLYANGLLEKPDHGAPLPLARLQGASRRFLTESANMLHIFGITRKSFEDWVRAQDTLVNLAR